MRMNTFGRYFFVIALSAATNLGWSFELISRYGRDGSSTTEMLNAFDSSIDMIALPFECAEIVCSYPFATIAAKVHNSGFRN